jgi:hypothetical protein
LAIRTAASVVKVTPAERPVGTRVEIEFGPALPADGRALDWASVRLRPQLELLPGGDDGERPARRQHGASDDPQPVAERPALRQAQELGGPQRAVRDEKGIAFAPRLDVAARIQGVLGEFL